MRPLALILLLALLAQTAPAAEPSPTPSWPLWDGAETVEQYAKKTGLEPTRTLDLGNGIKMEMVLIPAGKFIMGAEEPESPWIGLGILAVGGLMALVMIAMTVTRAIRERRRPQFSLRWLILLVLALGVTQYGGFRWWRTAEAWRNFDFSVSPAHEVTISKPYYLGKFEVTQDQYQQVTGTNPSHFKGRDLPVEGVSWDDAQEFCKKVSEKTGLVVRLPTEAEWEHACRAGTRTSYNTGGSEADLDRAAWYGNNSNGTTHPVGQKVPNAWGTYDMHGNVWEWVQDFYEPYKAEATTDPIGPSEWQYRVLRGGSWYNHPGSCRSADRDAYNPDSRNPDFGFRVVGSLPKTP
jgi:formylglycine-generating enzyme required for sulfatase activity